MKQILRGNVLRHLALPLAAGFVQSLVPGAPVGAVDACVRPGGAGGCFASIEAAVNDASVMGGDTVRVAKGRYLENVTIPAGKDGLVLQGAKGAIIDADDPGTGPGITVQSNDVTIERIAVHFGNEDGIRVGGASGVTGVTLRRVEILSSDDRCIETAAGSSGLRVERSVLRGCNEGIYAEADGVVIERNRFEQIGSNGVQIDGANARVERNRFFLTGETCIQTLGNGHQVLRNRGDFCERKGIDQVGNDFVISRNRMSGSESEGVLGSCVVCTKGEVSRNRVSVTGADDGFDLNADAPGLVAESNRVERSGRAGFNISGVGVAARSNTANQTGSDPIGDVTPACFLLEGANHRLENAKASNCGADGIKVRGTGHTVVDSQVKGALGDGFDVDDAVPSDGNTLLDNRSQGTLGVGFAVSANVTNTTLTGNKASGNLIADFCDGGTLTSESGNQFETEFDPAGGECPAD